MNVAAVSGFIIAAVVAVIAIFILVAVALVLVRIALALLLAMAAGGIIAAISSIWIDDAWPLVFMGASILLAFPAIGWMFRDSSLKAARAPANTAPKVVLPPEPAGDTELIAAWEKANSLAPGYALRLMAARESCAQLLNRSELSSLDMALIEGAQMIRTHVPDVVAHNGEAIADSVGEEQNLARLALVEDLETIARIAQARLARRKEAGRDGLATLRAHLSARSTE
ncbi:MAG: hypothetical protein CL820_12490 [Croceicoccus sp.]|nr:hypothetical protein [Croceicoccus sp.]MAL26681.1 hypothetical protein [Croceicoccus sp.]